MTQYSINNWKESWYYQADYHHHHHCPAGDHQPHHHHHRHHHDNDHEKVLGIINVLALFLCVVVPMVGVTKKTMGNAMDLMGCEKHLKNWIISVWPGQRVDRGLRWDETKRQSGGNCRRNLQTSFERDVWAEFNITGDRFCHLSHHLAGGWNYKIIYLLIIDISNLKSIAK